MEKHWNTEVSIPKFLVKFSNTEKFCNSFQKNWEKFCRNVKPSTWKKLKKYLKIFKKLRSFEETGNNFLNEFSAHLGKNFE